MKDLIKNIQSSLPTYDVVLPFSKEEITFTPFKVKDSKNLSIILQEDNKKLALKALVDLLKNCCIKVNPLELCLADAEYLFLMIRSKSVEENINLIVNNNSIKINIYDIKTKNDYVKSEITVSPKLSLKIETPKLKHLLQLNDLSKKNLLLSSIKEIVVNKEVYEVDKFIPKEISEFLENLPLNVLSQLEKIEHPELQFSIKVNDEESEVSGFLSFFILR
jgi:hypothetical protein